MKPILFALSILLALHSSTDAQSTNYPKAKVSFEDFKGLVAEVEAHRANRLIDLNTFLKMAESRASSSSIPVPRFVTSGSTSKAQST